MKIKLHFVLALLCFSKSLFAQLPDGSIAPDFTTTDINGQTHHLYDYLNQGQPVVLHFFATWAGPSWDYLQTGELQATYEIYGPPGTGEIQVFSIEGDDFTPYEAIYGIGNDTQGDFTSIIDHPIIDDASLGEIYQISAFPSVMVICPNGYVYNSFNPWASLSEIMQIAWSCSSFMPYSDMAIYNATITGGCEGSPNLHLDFQNMGNEMEGPFDITITVGDVQSTITYPYTLDPYATGGMDFPLNDITDGQLVLAEIALTDDYMGNNSISVIYNYVEPIESTSHLHLDFTTDEFPSDVTWNITDAMGNIVASGGPYYDAFTNIQDDIFLPGVGCYSFNLFDNSNNGIDTEELIILASIDDWGNGAFFNYDGTYEYGEIHVPFIVIEEVPFAITGFVFNDLNGNGIMEFNEPGLGQVEVSLDGLITLTNENGGFAFNDVTEDNMSISVSYDAVAWPVNTTPTSYDLSLTDATSFFFGLNDGVPFYDVTLFAGGDIPYICNTTSPIFIAVSNNSNQPVNVTLSALVDPALVVVYSEPAFTTLDNNTSVWELTNLAPGSITYIQLYVMTPGEEYIGTPITGMVSMVVTDMNMNEVDSETQTFAGEFYCSFDPNDISVKPEGATDQHYIQNGTELEYLIRFQNTGNYPATDVIIECALDSHLDFSTLEIVSTSHAGQLNFNAETGMLEFVFHNIYLADSVNNEPESHGFLRFKVMPLNYLEEGTVISESAAIYFDLNQPVITNTVFNTISDLYFGIDEDLASFSVYPNPADDRIQFNLSAFSGKMNIELLDATGRQVKQLSTVASERAEMNVNEIPAGVYHVKITNSNGNSYSEKVVIK